MLYGSVVDHRCRGQRVIELFTLKNKKIIIMLLLGEISLYVPIDEKLQVMDLLCCL